MIVVPPTSATRAASRAFGAPVLMAVAVLVVGCATAPLPGPPPGSSARAPYDAPPAAKDDITINLDDRAARSLLALLSKDRFDPVEAKLLEVLPAVKLAIRESNRPPETFERDLAAAFDEQARIAMFDFRKIRDERSRWNAFLSALSAKQDEITRKAATRAAALLPADIAVSVTTPISLTFGLPGRADHVLATGESGERMTVIDLARALAEEETAGPPEQTRAPLAHAGERGLSARLGRVPRRERRLAEARPRAQAARAAPARGRRVGPGRALRRRPELLSALDSGSRTG